MATDKNLAYLLQGVLVLATLSSTECRFRNSGLEIYEMRYKSTLNLMMEVNRPRSVVDAQDADTAEVAATVEKAEYRPLEPIRVSVRAKNVSGRQLLMPGRPGTTPEASYRIIRIRVFNKKCSCINRLISWPGRPIQESSDRRIQRQCGDQSSAR